MTVVLRRNVLNQDAAPPVALDRRRRRLSSVIARHAPKSRPFIVSVHRSGETLRPDDNSVRLRRQWRNTLVGRQDVVLITELPLGGGAGNTAKQVGSALAMVALTVAAAAIAGPVAGALVPAGFAATAGTVALVKAGIVIAGTVLIGIAAKPKANASEESRPLYGVGGGGNLPRPGDRIPECFGTFVTQPDLTQPDYSVYDGDDQVLYKRLTLGLYRYQVEEIYLGPATVWTRTGGVQPPFNAPPGGGGATEIGGGGNPSGSGGGTQIEIIEPGALSTLVPGSVYSSPSVAGSELPRPNENPTFAGPFPACPAGKQTEKIQLDYSLPAGVFNTGQNGQTATYWGVLFEYAPCDASNIATGPYTTLHSNGSGGTAVKITQGKRFTREIAVPAGRYLVRASNTNTAASNTTNTVTWDGLRAHFKETITRPHVTEIAMKIRSGKNLGVTAFGDVWVKAKRILSTWNGTAWVDATSDKAVYAFKSVMQGTYGAGLVDSEVDLERIKYYATNLTANDSFCGVIRGPVSVHEAASTILGAIRSEPVRLGNVWSINRDEQKTVRKHKFTRRQIVRGTTSLSFDVDRSHGEADVIVEYNPDADPRRRRDVRVTFGAQSLTPRRVNGMGIPTWAQAQQHAKWLAAAAYYRRERHRFVAEHQGRIVNRGDPASVDSWFIADAKAAGVLSRNNLELTLDTNVDVPASTYASFRDRRGRDWGPVLVTAGAAPNIVNVDSADAAAVAASSGVPFASVFANDNEDITSVLIGPLDQKTYLISSVQPQSKERIAIDAVLDESGVWTALGEAIPAEPPIPSVGDAIEPTKAVVPWVRALALQKATALVLEWAVGSARGAASYVVRLSYDNGVSWEEINSGLSTSGSYPLRHENATTLKVGAYAVSKQGVPGPAVYTTLTTFRPAVNNETALLAIASIDLLDGSVVEQKLAAAAVTATKIADAAIAATKFAAGIEPVSVVSALPNPTGYTGVKTAFNTTDGKLYRYFGGVWTPAVPAADVSGQLTDAQIAALDAAKLTSGIMPPARIADGSIVNAKIAGVEANKITIVSGGITNAQIADLAAAKITGQITGTQITDGAVSTPKLAAASVVADKLAASSVVASKLAVGSAVANLVVNGDFEDGLGDGVTVPSAWTSVPGNASAKAYSVNTSSFGGTKAMILWRGSATPTSANAGELITATARAVSAIPADTYELSCYAAFERVTTQGFFLYADFYDRAGAFISRLLVANDVGGGTGWTKYTGQIVTPANTASAVVTLTLQTNAACQYAVVDEVSLRRAMTSTLIEDGAITTNKIVANAVTASRIASRTITANEIATRTITALEIVSRAITANEIAANTLTANELAAGAVTAVTIAAGAVTTAKLAAAAVTANEIAANTITAAQIASRTITALQIATNTLTANEIAANTLTAGQIAAGAIGTTQLAAGAVTTPILAAGSVVASKLAVGTQLGNLIINGDFEDGFNGWSVAVATNSGVPPAVTTGSQNSGTSSLQLTHLADGVDRVAVDATKFPVDGAATYEFAAWFVGNSSSSTMGSWEVYAVYYDAANAVVSAPRIAYGAISAGWVLERAQFTTPLTARTCTIRIYHSAVSVVGYLYVDGVTVKRTAGTTLIEDGSITTSKIVADAITANQIAAGAITANHIAAGAITADKIVAGSINTTALAVNSVDINRLVEGASTKLTSYRSGTVSFGPTAGLPGERYNTLLGSISISSVRGNVLVVIHIFVSDSGWLTGQNPNVTWVVEANGVEIVNLNAATSYNGTNFSVAPITITAAFAVGSGSTTINLYGQRTRGGGGTQTVSYAQWSILESRS